MESLHIGGDYLLDPDDAVVINSSGIGIGTTSIRFGLGVDAEKVDAIFGTVGIGTTDTESTDVRLYVNGPSIFAGNVSISGIISATSFIGNGLGLTGISTTDTNYWNKTTAGIHTLSKVGIGTTNPTSALTVAGDTLISGVTTSTGGFTSGIGNAGQITTVGNKLFFTVPGVGTTSLTLF